MKKLEGGFSVVEGLLIFIIVGIIGGTGWYVMQANKKTNDTLNNAGLGTASKSTKKTNPPSAPQADTTANWIAYSSKTGNFSLKYPSAWATATDPGSCGGSAATGIFLLGGNSASVGKCGSDDSGQITVTWRNDRNSCGDLDAGTWTMNSKETTLASGVKGTKITATAKDQGSELGTVPVGTKTVQYCFIANGKMYIADYTQLATYPNVLSDFDLMVTKTLQFHS
jgi:hypothetical protein